MAGNGSRGGASRAAGGSVMSATRRVPRQKSPSQVTDQANRLLDKLKTDQRTGEAGGMRGYTIRDRIERVNRLAKQVVPKYRHNPLRKGSSARAAFRATGPKALLARRMADNQRAWDMGMGRR